MHYLADQSLSKTLIIFDKLAEREPFELVLWLYPSTLAEQFPGGFGRPVKAGSLEPITEYEGGTKGTRTKRASYDSPKAKSILGCLPSIGQLIDSLALYRPGENEWKAASVPHERGMVLVREYDHVQTLRRAGINFSSKAPSWW